MCIRDRITTDAIGNSSEVSHYAVATDTDIGGATPTDILTNSSSHGGLSINQDGGNDAYLLADNGGEILGGLSALTFEHRFSTTDTTSQAFVSYFVAGATDQFKLVVQNNGDLLATIAGSQIIASNFDFRTLADGQEHAIAFTWDNTTGSWALYVNGSSVEDGTGLATGLTLSLIHI